MAEGIEFDEDKISYGTPRSSAQRNTSNRFSPGGGPGFEHGSQGGGLAGWLQRKGIAKSPGGAQAIMLGIILVNLAIIAFIFVVVL